MSLALLIWASLAAFSLFNFLAARRDFQVPPPQLWLDNILLKCGKPFNENTMFTVPAFVKMGLVSCPIGAYLGMLLDCKVSRTATHRDINDGPLRLGFMRLTASLVALTPLLIPYIFVKGEYTVYT